LIKQLPRLIPVVESLVRKPASPVPGDGRLDAIEQSLDRLLERSVALEARLRRMTLMAVVSTLLAVTALIVAFGR
jgi:hypothetical protein